MSEQEVPLSERKQAFGAWAEQYDRYRPHYPRALVSRLLQEAGHSAQRPATVVDLGAGTGLLTRTLVDLGARVIAVEPDERMASRLAEVVPGAQVLVGSAEQTGLDTASVDAVIGAQMWHWVDEAQAIPEVARILVPGGVFVPLWVLRDDRTDWVAEHVRLLRIEDAYRVISQLDQPVQGPCFDDCELLEFEFGQELDEDGLVGLVGTYSSIRLRGDLLECERLTRELVATHPALAGSQRITMPYVARAFLTRRNDHDGDCRPAPV